MHDNNYKQGIHYFNTTSYMFRMQVRNKASMTAYGSQLEAGLLSSRYPHDSAAQFRGILMLQLRFAIPVSIYNNKITSISNL